MLANANLHASDIVFTVATGYGRYRVTFGDLQVTEISCHARGAVAEFPGTRTVLDIGGQDTKAIRIGDSGEVVDFAMNDKCAAGTGRFLGAASFALEMPLSELGPLALKSTKPVKITTTCTVFAETEIIGHLAKGHLPEDVLMGMHHSIATRCASLVRRVGLAPEITFTVASRATRPWLSCWKRCWARRSMSARGRSSWALSTPHSMRLIMCTRGGDRRMRRRRFNDDTDSGN